MPLQATSGAASYDAFGGGVAAVPNYIEDVFSTWLYTGSGSTQTINNGIDLAGKGGLVWTKSRGGGASNDHILKDTVRGGANWLYSNNTFEQQTGDTGFSFGSTGFTLSSSSLQNQSTINHVSWTFREQPKFFDVVTYTGNSVSGRQIAHNLGSEPGCIIVKGTSIAENWTVYHRSQGATKFGLLDQTDAFATSNDRWNDTTPTSTVFTVGNAAKVNASGQTYVAYLFAHNAGGFGLTGTDNVISCGSYTGTGTTSNTVTLGYEPQWLMIKRTDAATSWAMLDNMRGMPDTAASSNFLFANLSDAEATGQNGIAPTATGFKFYGTGSSINASGGTYIYIAIRRGPMKVPTTGTSVFAPVAYTGNGSANRAITTGFVPDMVWWKSRSNGTDWKDATLLIGTGRALSQNTTDAEGSVSGYYINTYNNTGFTYGTSDASYNTSGWTYVVEGFSRAPGFFDVVCYTGTGSARTVAHNLTVAPELIIAKARSVTQSWWTFSGITPTQFNRMNLNLSDSRGENSGDVSLYNTGWGLTAAPTSTSIFYDNSPAGNQSGVNYVAYLFASAPGVSKVGTFTGTGTTQTINCDFTSGARFVLIKAASTSGNWLVWDSARGIVAGNDPYLALNSTAAEVTNTDWVDTAASGFELSNAGGNLANSNGVSYIFWAVA